MPDENGVEAFEIGEDNELLQRGVIEEVALGVGMSVAPLFRGLAEEGDIEQIGLVGIDERGLLFRDARRYERLFDGIGVDAVVDLGEGALEIPAELETVVFVVLEALEFLDEVELELRAEPRSELEGDVFVGKGAASVTSGPRLEPNGSSGFNPLPGSQGEAIQAGLVSKGLEFETFKIGIVDLFQMPMNSSVLRLRIQL